jgi:hypothetical protein
LHQLVPNFAGTRFLVLQKNAGNEPQFIQAQDVCHATACLTRRLGRGKPLTFLNPVSNLEK